VVSLCLLGGLVVVAVAARLVSRAPSETPLDVPPAVNGIQVLKPEALLGKMFALRSHIDVGARLDTRHWIVILYRPDCDDCRRALPRYEALAFNRPAHTQSAGVALGELPP
jgi:hypothetical protein